MGWAAIQLLLPGASELNTAPATTGTGGSLGGAIGYGRTIATGFPAYLPASFAKSRFNHLVIVNGLKRGLFWDGISGAAENLGIESADTAPGVSVADGGNSEEGEYTLAYRYIDSRGIPGDLSPVTVVEAGADDLFSWTVPHPTEGRITKIQTYRSLVGVADPLYLVSNHTIGGQIYASTTASAGAATNIATLIPHSLAGTETVILSGHSTAALNGTGYTPTVVDNYNFTIPVAFTANGFGGTFTRVLGSLSYSDTMSDETLGERDVLVITEVGGELGARAHHPPPQNKMVVAQFQDRMWYGGDPEYDEGTVSYTHNSSTITGSGTNWTSAMEGRYFYLRNPDTSYRAQYIVSAVNSTTSLTLDQPYMGTTASGLSYVIANDPLERNTLYFCADEETEVLTKQGWKHHWELLEDDEALCLDPHRDQILWGPIERVNRFPFSGELTRWTSKKFDALTTDDHRWVAKGCGMMGGHWTLRVGGEDKRHFVTTGQCKSQYLVTGGGQMAFPPEKTYSDEFVELCGWYLTEGSACKTPRAVMVSQSRKHNPGYCDRITELADHFRDGGATATVCKPQIGKWGEIQSYYFGNGIGEKVREACPGKEKRLTPEFLSKLTSDQLEILFQTMMSADGHRKQWTKKDGTPGRPTQIFTQKSREACEMFQMLCAMTGRRSGITKCFNKKYQCWIHHVTAYNSPHTSVPKLRKSKEAYDGTVWCPTTPTGTWMARRNGKTYWTGNSEVDSPESVPVTNVLVIQENTGDDDRIVGLMPYGSALFVLKERHIYRMTFVRQPIIDANVNLVCSRGVFNHRCWDTYEGVSYLMDQHGCYAFDTAEPVPLSAPIQNYFREGLIDLAYSKWFHVKVDPRLEVVRFYVKFTADTGTRPKRALVYNIRSGAWWIETYVCEIGDAVQATVSGVLRAIFGTATNADLFFTHSSGTADGVSTAIRGTVTSAAAGTLVDSSAPFTAGSNPKPGSSVAILTGTGAGQVREITAFPSNTTTLSISPVWTTTPDTTSTYAVGAVPWSLKTKEFAYVGTYPSDKKDAERNERGIYITHQPTTNAHYWDLSRYLNHSATAETATIDRTFGDGWSQTSGSSGVRYDMRTARSSFGSSNGLAHFRFPDGQEPSSPGSPKFVTLELNGFQVDEQIIIYDILVDGGE
jgi:hypothetical protein